MFVEDIVPIPLSSLYGSMPQPPSESFEEYATLSSAIPQLSAFSSTQARRFVVQAISMPWIPACKCRRKSHSVCVCSSMQMEQSIQRYEISPRVSSSIRRSIPISSLRGLAFKRARKRSRRGWITQLSVRRSMEI